MVGYTVVYWQVVGVATLKCIQLDLVILVLAPSHWIMVGYTSKISRFFTCIQLTKSIFGGKLRVVSVCLNFALYRG